MATKKKKLRPPASPTPHDCWLLCVDTAEVSGWSIWRNGNLDSHGEMNVLRHSPEALLRDVFVRSSGEPVVLVLEKPFFGTSQGQYIGLWKYYFLQVFGQARRRRIVSVYPSQWRARVLPSGGGRRDRDSARRQERAIAALEVDCRPIGDDEAAAICIGLWARLAGEVAAKLPKKITKAVDK
jgi:hypothetical protein